MSTLFDSDFMNDIFIESIVPQVADFRNLSGVSFELITRGTVSRNNPANLGPSRLMDSFDSKGVEAARIPGQFGYAFGLGHGSSLAATFVEFPAASTLVAL
jgi:hypothetical protein